MATTTDIHTKECAKWMRIAKARKTRFLNRYPSYCKDCGAYGYYSEQNYCGEWDENECPKCLGKGICPRCANETIAEKEQEHESIYPEYVCSFCHWQSDDGGGVDQYCIPFEPICTCSVR